ncbi:hypothetical protein GGI35DRAFT_212031 [Trichoderma velutinum]
MVALRLEKSRAGLCFVGNLCEQAGLCSSGELSVVISSEIVAVVVPLSCPHHLTTKYLYTEPGTPVAVTAMGCARASLKFWHRCAIAAMLPANLLVHVRATTEPVLSCASAAAATLRLDSIIRAYTMEYDVAIHAIGPVANRAWSQSVQTTHAQSRALELLVRCSLATGPRHLALLVVQLLTPLLSLSLHLLLSNLSPASLLLHPRPALSMWPATHRIVLSARPGARFMFARLSKSPSLA